MVYEYDKFKYWFIAYFAQMKTYDTDEYIPSKIRDLFLFYIMLTKDIFPISSRKQSDTCSEHLCTILF